MGDLQNEEMTKKISEKNILCVKLAEDILKEAMADNVPKDAMQRLVFFQEKYPDFAKAYPVQLSYMVCQFMYDSDIFMNYLNAFTRSPRKVEYFIEYQADYALQIHQKLNPDIPNEQLLEIRKNIKKDLTEQFDAIKEQQQKFEKKYDTKDKNHLKQRQQELFNLYNNLTEEDINLLDKKKEVLEICDEDHAPGLQFKHLSKVNNSIVTTDDISDLLNETCKLDNNPIKKNIKSDIDESFIKDIIEEEERRKKAITNKNKQLKNKNKKKNKKNKK